MTMSIRGTFDTFNTARLGIYAAQLGLSVTGNNIANINATGYTRQTLDQVSLKTGGSDRYQSQYDLHVGNGVICTSVSQIRDPYLDIRYRSEMSSVGALDEKISGLNQIADVLDEVGDGDDGGSGIIQAQL
jgi:flagellar hook-associated protein 1 FlgK